MSELITLGVAMVLAGLIVLVIEAHASSGGVLGIAGALASAAGIGLLISGSGAGTWVAIPISLLLAAIGVSAVAVGAHKAIAALRTAVRTGPNRLIGSPATVRHWSGGVGQVAADGTLWRARVELGWEREPAPVPGESVIIEKLHGLTLSVRPRQPWELDSS